MKRVYACAEQIRNVLPKMPEGRAFPGDLLQELKDSTRQGVGNVNSGLLTRTLGYMNHQGQVEIDERGAYYLSP